MSTPIREEEQYSFPAFAPVPGQQIYSAPDSKYDDEDGTLGELPEGSEYSRDDNHLKVTTSYSIGPDYLPRDTMSNASMSPSAARANSRRLDDDLEMLRAERHVDIAESKDKETNESGIGRSKSVARSRSRPVADPLDDFDVGTTPIHEVTRIYQPPPHPANNFAKFFKKVHNSSFLVRYFCYISPVTLLLLIPVMLAQFVFPNAAVGGVELFWFGIWLEVVWLTLWLARVSDTKELVRSVSSLTCIDHIQMSTRTTGYFLHLVHK